LELELSFFNFSSKFSTEVFAGWLEFIRSKLVSPLIGQFISLLQFLGEKKYKNKIQKFLAVSALFLQKNKKNKIQIEPTRTRRTTATATATTKVRTSLHINRSIRSQIHKSIKHIIPHKAITQIHTSTHPVLLLLLFCFPENKRKETKETKET
jgi:hypothetical protein